jgi:hypothetical protein
MCNLKNPPGPDQTDYFNEVFFHRLSGFGSPPDFG